jgi:two-component system, chemotaxis family, protein-glutamate methylesterase/glutaminase
LPATEIIVIGASAGGVEAVSALVERLPHNLNAAVFVVLHFPENATSVLPKILNRHRTLIAKHPEEGERIEKAHVYVAPPGLHLLLKPGRIRLVRGPKENGHRPAIDPLFRTAAHVYGRRVAGVILSGLLDDGVIGANGIKTRGGKVLAQDPEDAVFGDLPRNTIAGSKVDFVGTVAELAFELTQLAGLNDSDNLKLEDENMEEGLDITEMAGQDLPTLEPKSKPSAYTCPECNGTLFETTENGVKNFRCRVGHAYSHETLEVHQTEELEAALWEALRSMEENVALCRMLLDRASNADRRASVRYYTEKVDSAQKRIALVRSVLNQTMLPVGNTEGP